MTKDSTRLEHLGRNKKENVFKYQLRPGFIGEDAFVDLGSISIYLRQPVSSLVFSRITASKICRRKMAVSRWQKRLHALAMCLVATQEAQAAFTNSSATVTSKASLPTGGSGNDKPCEFAAGSVMIWDWSSAQTAGTVTHTIVPHITTYPNGSSVTNNETVLATATLPGNASVSTTRVVSGFTMYVTVPEPLLLLSIKCA